MMKFTNKSIILITSTAALAMFAFSFALSPLYRIVCKKTGLNGGATIAEVEDSATGAIKHTEPVLVQFTATANASLPWEFHPEKNHVTVTPERTMKVIFYAHNNTKKTMTVQAIPSFSPALAAQYFHKIECFCFTQQTLQPGETKEMPVVFRVDGQLPQNIHTITLAYTLFDVSKKRITS